MNIRNKIILTSVIGVIVIYLILDFQCRLGIKCKNCPRYSKSIDLSKEKGLFVAEYKLASNKVKLKNYNDTLLVTKAWGERRWRLNSDICLFAKREIIDGYNFSIEIGKGTVGSNFSMRGEGKDWGYWTPTIMTTTSLSDTLIIQILEKDPNNWKTELAGEKLKFIRVEQSNSR